MEEIYKKALENDTTWEKITGASEEDIIT